jgi:uncharacterized protein (TIGR00369 family)
MNKQPNSRHCFVCGVENDHGLGMKFYEVAPGEVQAEYTVPEHFQGYPGVVHGGVIAAMLDEVTGRAFMHGEPPRFMYTAKLSVRYRKPVPVGEPLRLVGRAGRDNGRIAEASGEIYRSDGTLLAEAEAVLVNVPEKDLDGIDLETIGWKVYPDGKEGQ